MSPDRLIDAARARRRDEGGFTIAESLTALAVLFIVILALIASITVSIRGVLTGRQRSTALDVAEEMMEEIRAADYERVGHDLDDPTLPSDACPSVAPANSTDFWYDCTFLTHRYDDPTTGSMQDGESIAAADPGLEAVVGGVDAPIANHYTTGEVDDTPWDAWVYITKVDPPSGDPHKRVTIIITFDHAQYDTSTVENRAKLSSLVFPNGAVDDALITAEAHSNAGSMTLSGTFGDPISSFVVTFPRADGTLRTHFADELTGSADSSWSQLDGGASAENASGDCSISGGVATCPMASVNTVNDDDDGTGGIDEYDSESEAAATGTIGAGSTLSVPWDGGTISSRESACHGMGGACGPAISGAADGLPRGVHTGTGPDDLSMPLSVDLDVPGDLIPDLPLLTGSWLQYSGGSQATADIDQGLLGAAKQTTPTASVSSPPVDILTINDSLGLLPPVTVLRVDAFQVSAAAPVGPLAGDADVAPATVSFTVAGDPLALPVITTGSGASASVTRSLVLGLVDVSFTVSVRTGNEVETETRDGSTVIDSYAELTDTLVVTVDFEIVRCSGGILSLLCLGNPPAVVADASITLDYGDVLARATHSGS